MSALVAHSNTGTPLKPTLNMTEGVGGGGISRHNMAAGGNQAQGADLYGFAAVSQRERSSYMSGMPNSGGGMMGQNQHYGGSGGGVYGGYMTAQGIGGTHAMMNQNKQFNSPRMNKTMGYRDSATIHNPTPQTATFMSNFEHLFNDDIAPQPQINYNYDRIHNDLLDEICSDIGIKDTMELDFVDFEPGFNNIKSWDTNNMKKPGFEDDILDQIIPFGDEERRTSGETEPVLGFTKLSEEPIGKLNNKVKIETNSPVCSPVVHSTSGNAQGNVPSPISTCSSYQAGTPEGLPECSPSVTSSSTDTEPDSNLEKIKKECVDQNSNLHTHRGQIKEEHPSSTTPGSTTDLLEGSTLNLIARSVGHGMQRCASPVRTCQSMPASVTCSPSKVSRAGGRFVVPHSPAKGLLAQTLSARLQSHLGAGYSPSKKMLPMSAPSPSSASSSPNLAYIGGSDNISDLATRLSDADATAGKSEGTREEKSTQNHATRGLESPLIDQGYYSVGSPSLPSSQQTAQFGGSVPDIVNTGEEKVYTFLEGPSNVNCTPNTTSSRHRVHQLQGSTRLSPRSASLSLDDIPLSHQRSDIPAMDDLYTSNTVSVNNALSASMPAGLDTCSTATMSKGLHHDSTEVLNQQYGSQVSVNSNTSTSQSDLYGSKPSLGPAEAYYQQKMLSRTSRVEYSPYQRVQSSTPKTDNLANAMRCMARATGYNQQNQQQNPYNRAYPTSQGYNANMSVEGGANHYQTNNNNNMEPQSYNMNNVPMSPSKMMSTNDSTMGPSMSQLENQMPDGTYDRFKPIAPVVPTSQQPNRMYQQTTQSKPSPYDPQSISQQNHMYNNPDPNQQQQSYQQQQISQQQIHQSNPQHMSQSHHMVANTPGTQHTMGGNSHGQQHPMVPAGQHPMASQVSAQCPPSQVPSQVPPGQIPGQCPPGVTPGQPEIIGDLSKSTMFAHNNLLQRLIADRSSAFRSHPLFPLLRDLIVADMNFYSPTFPFQLIANLPCDFDRLLQNYLSRNPPVSSYRANQSVESVITDALRHAHSTLIEKISQRKQQRRFGNQPKNMNAIEDFCERFDRAVKNTLDQNQQQPTAHPQHHGMLPGHPQQGYPGAGQYPGQAGGMVGHPQGHPGMPGHIYPGQMADPMAARINQQRMYGGMMPGQHPMQQQPPPTQPTKKHQVLPKEAVAIMLDWLREHQDNPYPNDDEKDMLIHRTRLTINQINYWFTNARRRILPKWALQRAMDEKNSTDTSGSGSAKGSKSSDKTTSSSSDVSTTTSVTSGTTVIPQSPSSTTNSAIPTH